MSRTIDIACTLNDAYARPFSVMLASLLGTRRGADPIVLHVLDSGLMSETRGAIEHAFADERITFDWIQLPSSTLKASGVPLRRSPVLYQTLLLPQALPLTLTRLIYLDVDLLFLRPVEELWETCLEGRPLAAAQDMAIPRVSSPQGVKDFRARGIPAGTPYFNAGVMVIDLAEWRSRRVADRAIEYLRANRGHAATCAQDAYNAIEREWKTLPLAWNVIASVAGRRFFTADGLDPREYDAAVAHPAIVHFAGRLKPWLTRTGSRFDATYRAWRDRAPQLCAPAAETLLDRAAGYYDRTLRPACYRVERFFWERRA